MATPYGSRSGPIYPLGKITVAAAGTPVALSANVPITSGTLGSATPIQANQVIVSAPSTNTGDVFLVFKAQGYNGTGGTSVIFAVAKGTTQKLVAPNMTNPFTVAQLGIDAVTTNDVAYVTLLIGV